ncbi:MAG: hypothetical protein Q4A16_09935 [Lautropia sp.]|nr:hypothetical protein [Lautropia sp.]
MRNTIHTLSLLAVLLSLSACGGGGGPDDTGSAPSSSQPQAPGQRAAGDAGQGTQAISAQGVDGAVLATMLVQNTYTFTNGTGARLRPMYHLYGAVPWNASDNSPIAPANAPTVFGFQQYAPEIREPATPSHFSSASFITNFTGFPDFGRFTDLRTRIQLSLHLPLETEKASVYLFSDEAMKSASAGQNILTLEQQATVTAQVRAPTGAITDDFPPMQTLSLKTARTGVSLKHGERHVFGKVIRQWRDDGDNQLQLQLLPGRSEDRARLCLQHRLSDAKRRSCALWRVPAGWQFGQPLHYEGISVDDDRSVHPGDSGHLQWQTPVSG